MDETWVSFIAQHFPHRFDVRFFSFSNGEYGGRPRGRLVIVFNYVQRSYRILSRCQTYSWDSITNALLSCLSHHGTKAGSRKCPADTLAGTKWEKITNLKETCCLLFFIMRDARVYTEQASSWYWDTKDLNASHTRMSFAICSNKRDWSLGR